MNTLLGKPGTERVRTRERAMKRLVEKLAAVSTLERVAIVHTNSQSERSARLFALAAGLHPQRDILTVDITPVIGAHTAWALLRCRLCRC